MIFTLEALEAKRGDSLLLHYGSADDPQLIVIDGGPAGVYAKSLKPRLDELKATRALDGPLPVRMLMVSHIDDDHINGVIQMMRKLDQLRQEGRELPYDVQTLWHNSFDDIVGNGADELTASLAPAAAAASLDTFPSDLPVRHDTALVLASVDQGRELRSLADALSLNVNEGFDNLVMVSEGEDNATFKPSSKLAFTIVGPHEEEVLALQAEWDEQIKKSGVAEAAAFADKSVFNLSSIVVHAAAGTGSRKRTMLLTGDARGDHILTGLNRAGLMRNGVCHVDLLKVPHHGSDRNVTTEFFRQVVADHYVISADGAHHNPDVAMFKMLSEARGQDEYTIHLTNGVLPKDEKPRKLLDFFKRERTAGKRYEVVIRKSDAISIQVDLGEASI